MTLVLLDENVPAPLARLLGAHDARTVAGMGWRGLSNGRLLDAAEAAGFRRMVTADRNMPYQQSLSGRTLGVVILPSNRLAVLRGMLPAILAGIAACDDGAFHRMSADGSIE